MDLLRKELERKKKNVEKAKTTSGGRRFVRAKDLRRFEEEEALEKEQQQQQLQLETRKRKKGDDEDEKMDAKMKSGRLEQGESNTDKNKNRKEKAATGETTDSHESEEDSEEDSRSFKMSPEEITEKLRSLGYPIKLFGERSWDRLKRLQKALDDQKNVQAVSSEMDEYRLGKGHSIRNPFLEKEKHNRDAAAVTGLEEDDDSKQDGDAAAAKAKQQQEDNKDLDLDENDPHKRVYRYFKNLMNQWEDDLALRPDSVKRSVAGRNETKTAKQCKDYIRPLFKLCKKRSLDESILHKLNKIVTFCLQEDFVKAHDTYIDISIGRAAWPIGVTMVGIHARTGTLLLIVLFLYWFIWCVAGCSC